MALIKCPECGRENVSSSAAACPDCGFDLKAWQKKLDDEKRAEEEKIRAQENLEKQRQFEIETHEKALSAIPDPTPYGDVKYYIIIAVVGVLLGLGSPVFFIIGLLGAGGYYLKANNDYKSFLADPKAYKETQIAKQAAKLTSTSDNSTVNATRIVAPSINEDGKVFCPKCGSENVTRQVFQENKGSTTITHGTSKYKEKGHGIFWWLLIGWWWWFVDLLSWIFFFFPRLILRLFAAPFKKKKYVGTSNSVSTTTNNISYRTICTCQNCGHTW